MNLLTISLILEEYSKHDAFNALSKAGYPKERIDIVLKKVFGDPNFKLELNNKFVPVKNNIRKFIGNFEFLEKAVNKEVIVNNILKNKPIIKNDSLIIFESDEWLIVAPYTFQEGRNIAHKSHVKDKQLFKNPKWCIVASNGITTFNDNYGSNEYPNIIFFIDKQDQNNRYAIVLTKNLDDLRKSKMSLEKNDYNWLIEFRNAEQNDFKGTFLNRYNKFLYKNGLEIANQLIYNKMMKYEDKSFSENKVKMNNFAQEVSSDEFLDNANESILLNNQDYYNIRNLLNRRDDLSKNFICKLNKQNRVFAIKSNYRNFLYDENKNVDYEFLSRNKDIVDTNVLQILIDKIPTNELEDILKPYFYLFDDRCWNYYGAKTILPMEYIKRYYKIFDYYSWDRIINKYIEYNKKEDIKKLLPYCIKYLRGTTLDYFYYNYDYYKTYLNSENCYKKYNTQGWELINSKNKNIPLHIIDKYCKKWDNHTWIKFLLRPNFQTSRKEIKSLIDRYHRYFCDDVWCWLCETGYINKDEVQKYKNLMGVATKACIVDKYKTGEKMFDGCTNC